MNSNPTSYVQTVDSAMIFIVVVSLIFLLGISATMVFFVIKYNRKKGAQPVDIHGSILLETIWFIVPLILVMAMFYYGFIGYKDFKNIPDDAMQIDVTGRMWDWDFVYENGANLDTLYVPINKPVKLNMISVDVNHSLYIPAFRVKQDVIGGSEQYLVFTAEKEGSYNVACAEYCGLEHSAMYTKVVVMPEDKYQEWYESVRPNKAIEVADSLKTN